MTFARPTIILLASIVLYEVGEASIAAEAAPSGLYEMRTETGMPNLEDNLLYAVVTERRCLNPRELSGAFWMMSDVSLQDCTLVKTEQTDDASTYALKCEGGMARAATPDGNWDRMRSSARSTCDLAERT